MLAFPSGVGYLPVLPRAGRLRVGSPRLRGATVSSHPGRGLYFSRFDRAVYGVLALCAVGALLVVMPVAGAVCVAAYLVARWLPRRLSWAAAFVLAGGCAALLWHGRSPVDPLLALGVASAWVAGRARWPRLARAR